MKQTISFEVRVADDLFRRMAVVAAAEGRTVNNQMMFLMRQNIAYFERTHGKITAEQTAEIDVEKSGGKTSGE